MGEGQPRVVVSTVIPFVIRIADPISIIRPAIPAITRIPFLEVIGTVVSVLIPPTVSGVIPPVLFVVSAIFAPALLRQEPSPA